MMKFSIGKTNSGGVLNKRDGLQLLPGTKKRLGIKIPGENRFLYTGSAILGFVIVTSFSLSRYVVSLEDQISQVNNEIIALEEQRDKKVEKDMVTLGKRIEMTATILDEHVYLTKALSRVVSSLQSEVEFKSMSISVDKGEISFEALVPNYTVLARQVATFIIGEGVEDVSLGRITSESDSGKLKFTMQIKFDKSTFFFK